MKRWVRLIHGLRIRARLQAQYADRGTDDPASAAPVTQGHAAVNQKSDEVCLAFLILTMCFLYLPLSVSAEKPRDPFKSFYFFKNASPLDQAQGSTPLFKSGAVVPAPVPAHIQLNSAISTSSDGMRSVFLRLTFLEPPLCLCWLILKTVLLGSGVYRKSRRSGRLSSWLGDVWDSEERGGRSGYDRATVPSPAFRARNVSA